MYTLYYFNKNKQIHSLKVASLDAPLLIPEDLIFCNLRKGINFIKEPHACIDFTDIERLIMNSEFYDSELLKESDFRRQNTLLSPLCQVDAPTELFNITSYYEDLFKVFDVDKIAFDFANNLYLSNSIDYGETWERYLLEYNTTLDYSINEGYQLDGIHYYINIPNSRALGVVRLENETGDIISNVYGLGG